LVKRIIAGEITTAHGIKGFVKVRCYAEDAKLLERGPIFTEDGKTISLKLKNGIKGDWIAEVKGIDDRNAAELLRGTKLYIDRKSLPEADDGEFYVEDLRDMKVIDEAGKDIGTILTIVNYGAGDLVDIKPAEGGQSFYLPFNENTLVNVDLETRIVTISVPEAM
jgi:16S rRNA processing protein RimM